MNRSFVSLCFLTSSSPRLPLALCVCIRTLPLPCWLRMASSLFPFRSTLGVDTRLISFIFNISKRGIWLYSSFQHHSITYRAPPALAASSHVFPKQGGTGVGKAFEWIEYWILRVLASFLTSLIFSFLICEIETIRHLSWVVVRLRQGTVCQVCSIVRGKSMTSGQFVVMASCARITISVILSWAVNS